MIFVFYLLFVSNDDIITQYKNSKSLQALEQERDQLYTSIEANREKLYELSTNMETLEKFARENYRMKRPDEVIYVITPED